MNKFSVQLFQKDMWLRTLLFLVINFGALALGSVLMRNPATNVWYQQLDKAPWTPPGWVFGAAWFSIMILFSVFMARVTKVSETRKTWLFLFGIQFVLNVLWNPVFFRWHMVTSGLIILSLLILVISVLLKRSLQQDRLNAVFILPYLLWLFVAFSLNAYVVF
ncbi:MAG: tryptophan-rich sensory protein [Fluviicola sp.]|nr:tryptophan-rich sensory protein [Fluviicola sp.]